MKHAFVAVLLAAACSNAESKSGPTQLELTHLGLEMTAPFAPSSTQDFAANEYDDANTKLRFGKTRMEVSVHAKPLERKRAKSVHEVTYYKVTSTEDIDGGFVFTKKNRKSDSSLPPVGFAMYRDIAGRQVECRAECDTEASCKKFRDACMTLQ